MKTINTVEKYLPLLVVLAIIALVGYFIMLAQLLCQTPFYSIRPSVEYYEDARRAEPSSVEVITLPEPYECLTDLPFCELALPANTFVEEGTEVCYGVFYDGSNYTLVFQDGKAIGYVQPCASLELLKQQELETDEVIVNELLAVFETINIFEEEK